MWIVACVLAVVVLFHAVPTQAYSERSRHPSAPLTSPAVGHAKWRP
jgi:hypothetical protein